MSKAKVIEIIKTTVLVLVLGLGVGYAVADWTAPASNPPTCASGNAGCDAPINVSGTAQTKVGDFTSNGKVTAGSGLKINNGVLISADAASGFKGFHFRQANVGTDSATLTFGGNFILNNAVTLNANKTGSQTGLGAGTIYYDTTAGKFKCNENGTWKYCVGTGGGGITNVQTVTISSGASPWNTYVLCPAEESFIVGYDSSSNTYYNTSTGQTIPYAEGQTCWFASDSRIYQNALIATCPAGYIAVGGGSSLAFGITGQSDNAVISQPGLPWDTNNTSSWSCGVTNQAGYSGWASQSCFARCVQ